MPAFGWATIASLYYLPPRFLAASLYAFLFDEPNVLLYLARSEPKAIAGAYYWISASATYGYDPKLWKQLVSLRVGKNGPSPSYGEDTSLQALTLIAADSLNVNEAKYPWTDDQMRYLEDAGYNPSRAFDGNLWWERIVGGSY